MRLAYIKLAGFKSFVEPSKIPFPDSMTCVVGPNGCGKSNVIDAVRWVLGESSAKNLRGDAMADVIFNGSIERKPVSQASVELMFDNTQGRLPGTLAARNQISIKRLVTREGVSQYFLNGDQCRKRDITDIFLGTGLGPRSYAIIEQGMISRLIESKPQDLRVFIEEAAGVSKYKERRRETQTRLNSTRDNLERLLDLRTELDNQISVLSEQAEKAREYTLAKDKERTLKAQICVLKWQTLQHKLNDCESKLNDIQQQIDFYQAANTGHTDLILALKLGIEEANDALNNAQHQEYQLRNKLARDEQDKVHKQSQKTQLIKQSAQLENESQSHNDEQHHLQQKATEIKQQLSLCEQQLEERLAALELSIENLELHKATQDELYLNYQQSSTLYQSISTEQKEKQQQLTHLNIDLTKYKQQKIALIERATELDDAEKTANLSALESDLNRLKSDTADATSNYTQASEAVARSKQQLAVQKQQCEQLQQSVKALKAKRDALTLVVSQNTSDDKQNLLANTHVDKNWLLAVEACLFGLTQARIIEQGSVEPSLPAVWQDKISAKPDSLASKIHSDAVPRYFNAIALADELNNLDDSLWQQGFIAAVNQQGDIRGPNWYIPSGFDQDNSNLVKYQLLKEIEIELGNTEKTAYHEQTKQAECQIEFQERQAEYALYEDALRELEHALTRRQTQWDMAQKQLSHTRLAQSQTAAKRSVLEEQLISLNNDIAPLQTQLDEKAEQLHILQSKKTDTEQRYHHAVSQTQRLQAECDEQKSQHHSLQLQLTSLNNQQAICVNELEQCKKQNTYNQTHQQAIKLQLEEADIPLLELDELIMMQHDELEVLLEEKEDKQSLLETAKQNLAKAEKNIASEQGKLDQLTQKKNQAELDKQSYLLKSEAALAPLTELNKQLKEVMDKLPSEVKITHLQATLSRIVNDIEKLGAINLTAVEEFDKASTRKQYLDQQYDDLTTALSTLETAITKIDRETKQRFKSTFDKVNAGLQHLFPKVFGGGHAYLELTSDDLLDTGVTIMARPPGKKNATIHLLSGGEKALTALSLVFAIFQLNPAPFCMLDEVDAPLDDANVGRFCRLVEEMSQDVQFIYISHNKISMEMASRLTGVTMAEPGVSRVVAVDIEKAIEMAHSA